MEQTDIEQVIRELALRLCSLHPQVPVSRAIEILRQIRSWEISLCQEFDLPRQSLRGVLGLGQVLNEIGAPPIYKLTPAQERPLWTEAYAKLLSYPDPLRACKWVIGAERFKDLVFVRLPTGELLVSVLSPDGITRMLNRPVEIDYQDLQRWDVVATSR